LSANGSVSPLAMQMKESPWKTIRIVAGGFALCVLLVWVALRWPEVFTLPGVSAHLPSQFAMPPMYPLLELLKLAVAAVLGLVVTAVHKRYHRDKPLSRSLEQAQVLLGVAGAMIVIIIGDSLARAFGVLGAASIIRFRTPVEDPKDTIILFLLLALGMACGLGAFGTAALAALFICIVMLVLDHIGEQKPRPMMLELVAAGREFPTQHVQNVFAAYGMAFEPREVSQGDQASIKYHVMLAPNTSLEYLSDQLISGGYSGIKSVTWESPKKSG